MLPLFFCLLAGGTTLPQSLTFSYDEIPTMKLILFSKPGCHLCEGLQEKLEQVHSLQFDLEVRDITTRDDWFQAYQYEIPVLYLVASPDPTPVLVPRVSPRASIEQIDRLLQKILLQSSKNKAE
jgi:hypothetical protein